LKRPPHHLLSQVLGRAPIVYETAEVLVFSRDLKYGSSIFCPGFVTDQGLDRNLKIAEAMVLTQTAARAKVVV
jgi:hypothetical protein